MSLMKSIFRFVYTVGIVLEGRNDNREELNYRPIDEDFFNNKDSSYEETTFISREKAKKYHPDITKDSIEKSQELSNGTINFKRKL